MEKKLTKVLLCTILIFSVISCYDDCPRIFGKNITSYSYKPNKTTPKGYRIDTNDQEVDLVSIDCIIETMKTCFMSKGNLENEFETPDPECLKIVIADDWFHPINKETGEVLENIQIFPCDLPGAQGCAGVVQNNQIIIVTPDLAALGHELIHVQTGEADPFPDSFEPCDGIRAENCQEVIGEYYGKREN